MLKDCICDKVSTTGNIILFEAIYYLSTGCAIK